MPKVLLVEDDNNLREIFEMRLQAEGYETVTASNGEEALATAMKEKPDLIVADVMMPKLSGFEMLETLRAAPEMQGTKVVMMTALGQAEDQARGEKLGVLKYLVKSQVTLEDFAKVVGDVLPPGKKDESTSNNKQESEKPMPPTDSTPTNTDTPADGGDNPVAGSDPAAPADSGQMSTADAQAQVDQQVDDAMAGAPAPEPSTDGGSSDAPAVPASDAPSEPPASPEAPAEEQPPASPAV